MESPIRRWVRQASSPEHGFTTVGLSIHHSEGGIAETLDLRSAVHGRPQGMDGDYRTLSGGHAAEGSIECIFRKIRPYVHGRIAKPWLHRDP
jgi:hypothetical protein